MKWNTLATEHQYRICSPRADVEVTIREQPDERPSVHIFTPRSEDQPLVVYMNGRVVVNVA